MRTNDIDQRRQNQASTFLEEQVYSDSLGFSKRLPPHHFILFYLKLFYNRFI
jgi:hypothetical protein